MPERLLAAADVAEILGVTELKAAELMRGMRCINTSRNPDSKRPRWRVTASEIDRWQRVRAEIPDQRAPAYPVVRGRRASLAPAEYAELFEPDGSIKRRRAAK